MGLVIFELVVKIFQGNLRIFNWNTRLELYSPLPATHQVHRVHKQIHISLGVNPVISWLAGPTPELAGPLIDEDDEDIEAGQIYEIQDPEVAFARPPVRLRAAASRSRDRG